MNLITVTNTLIFFLVNAIHIMTMVVLQVMNLFLIDIGSMPVSIVSYLSQVFYLATILYLVLAFKHFSSGSGFIALYSYLGLNTLSILTFPYFAMRQEYFVYISAINMLSLIVCICCAIVSLTAKLQQLGAMYGLYFFSVLFTQLIMIFGPMLVLEYFKVEPYNYFRYVGFLSVIPYIIIFLILYGIQNKLEQQQQQRLFDQFN